LIRLRSFLGEINHYQVFIRDLAFKSTSKEGEALYSHPDISRLILGQSRRTLCSAELGYETGFEDGGCASWTLGG
jgi:hypothetical protein